MSEFLNDSKKENVYKRLKENAANLWGYKEGEMEGFDPLIELLIGACASEFEKLAFEINISQSRILEVLARMLLPEVLCGPNPAHAVFHARSVKSEFITSSRDQIFFEKEKPDDTDKLKTINKRIFFSPTHNFKLTDSAIVFIATEDRIFQIISPISKEEFSRRTEPASPGKHKIWLGLDVNRKIDNFINLSFFFDWKYEPLKTEYLNLLPLSKWSHNGKTLRISRGINQYTDGKPDKNQEDNIIGSDINRRIADSIKEYYREHFISIIDDFEPFFQAYPPELKKIFPDDDLAKIKNSYLWIEIELPELFKQDAINSMYCNINCFPIVNKRLYDSNRPFSLNTDINFIPLDTDEFFLSINRILSKKNRLYKETPYKKSGELTPGTYSIRSGGLTRFDQRDAQQLLQFLIELLREEYVSMSAIGGANIQSDLSEISKNLNRLKSNIIEKFSIKDAKYFLVIRPEIREDIWLEYWSCLGNFANSIPAGTPAFLGDYQKDTSILVSNTCNGKDPAGDLEKMYLFKSMLLSRDRIVTMDDIRNLCYSELGGIAEKVEVKKDIIMSTDRSKGYQRGIRVQIMISKEHDKINLDQMEKRIYNLLKSKSLLSLEFQIDIVEKIDVIQ